MKLMESGQMYLETIYVLSKEKSRVHSIDVSEHMGYSKPSVSRAIGILKSGGYVEMAEDTIWAYFTGFSSSPAAMIPAG